MKDGGGTWDRDALATYTITYAGGTGVAVVVTDQNADSGHWELLGTYDLSADGTESARLTHDAEHPGSTSADAVRWVLASSSPVAGASAKSV